MKKQGMISKANLDSFPLVILETPGQRNAMSLTKKRGMGKGSVFFHLKHVLSSFQFYQCGFGGRNFLQNNSFFALVL